MNRHHASFACIAALVLITALASASAGPKPPISLRIKAPKLPLKAGEQFILPIQVTNTTDHTVGVPVSMSPYGHNAIYRVHVRDQSGRVVPPRPTPPNVVYSGSQVGRYLEPGKSYLDHVDVTFSHDLSRPGTYKIWVAETYYFPSPLWRRRSIIISGPNATV